MKLPFSNSPHSPPLEQARFTPYVSRITSDSSRITHHASRAEAAIALIIVMISVTVLAILAAGFAYSMKVETRLARNANNETELEWLGRSGVEYARWILAEQMKIPMEPYDAHNQVWAGGPGGLGTSNSPLADVQREVKLGNGSFTWKIIDLDSKANINTATEPLLQQALMLVGVDASEMTPIVNSILDWIDPDQIPRVQGSESSDYQNLQPPYFAKDGPIDDLSELLLVKGITPDLYWGTISTNHPPGHYLPQTSHFQAAAGMLTYPVGLVDLFTPISGGKININTASAAVLQLVPGVDSISAEAIVAARDGEDDGSGLTGPYRSVDQVRRVPEVNMMVARQLQQFCDVRSRTFEVTVEAQISGYKRQFVAILGRNNPRDIQFLSFYWK
jgi:general secretion pathway protein K